MTKDYVIEQLHHLYRTDPWVNDLFEAAGVPTDRLAQLILDYYNSEWFSTMSESYVEMYEKKMGIVHGGTQTLSDRRAVIEARWKMDGTCTLELLQAVANSWSEGDCVVTFLNGKIQIKFVNSIGTPSDLDTLKTAIGNTIPAHLAVEYLFRYLLISEIHGVKTLAQMEQLLLDQFAG